MSDPLITVIICTRNRAGLLDLCLQSILRQTLPRQQYDILVVDNGSTDATAVVTNGYKKEGVSYLFEPVVGLSRARNSGWRAARGTFVGYIDDDATADITWLAAVLESFQQSGPIPDWVGGPIYLRWEVQAPEWINKELRVPLGYVYWGDGPRRLTTAERLGGGNSFYPRARLAELGGFEERLGRQQDSLLSGEETHLQKRIERDGGFLFYHPQISIHHNVPIERTRASWFYHRYFWGGVSDVVMRCMLPEDISPVLGRVVAEPKKGGRVGRLFANATAAMGLTASRARRIQGRIYVSYVLGHLYGIVRNL
jgi:glycosyltransferase involved in cell wall biosynthesis